MALNKDTVISTAGEEVIGNGANRFDAHRQSTTLGPEPPTADDGPPETNGEPGASPRAT
jgi:hypothetical protein